MFWSSPKQADRPPHAGYRLGRPAGLRPTTREQARLIPAVSAPGQRSAGYGAAEVVVVGSGLGVFGAVAVGSGVGVVVVVVERGVGCGVVGRGAGAGAIGRGAGGGGLITSTTSRAVEKDKVGGTCLHRGCSRGLGVFIGVRARAFAERRTAVVALAAPAPA
jgi:hypothetical protein